MPRSKLPIIVAALQKVIKQTGEVTANQIVILTGLPPSTVYHNLTRLQDKGWIELSRVEPTSVGSPFRYYKWV